MADNITLDAGSGGATIAADDIGGVHYQLIKLGYGALDSFTIVTASAGLPVAQQGTWTVTGAGGTFPVTDSGGSLTIDAPVGTPAFVRLSDGASAITTLPVSMAAVPTGASTAAKQPALGTAGTASSDVITVQGIASMTPLLATCTFASAQAVTQSGTWNVATVTTVTTVSTVTNLAQMGGAAIAMGTGVRSAGTQRVTIATDDVVPCSQSGTWTVTGAGGTFPVTDNSGSLTVDAPVGTPVFVRLSDGTSAITTLPVSMAAVPTGASTAAKQPALGTAGTASSDVITVQGIASMTPLLATCTFASAQAVTQSGTWNIGTVTTVSTVTAVTTVGTVTSLTQFNGNAINTDSGLKGAGTLRVVLATDQPALTNKLLVTPDLPSGASTEAKQPALGTAGTASADVITVQGITSMTPLLATLSGTNNIGTVTTVTTVSAVTTLNQFNGTTIATNSGSKDAGTLRVVLATDQPALTNKLLVTPDANSAVNISQMNGVAVTMGNGASGTGVQRVTIANDSTGVVGLATGTNSIGTVQPGNTANTTPWLVTDTPATSGGLSVSRVIDFSGTDQGKTSIKASAGQVFGIIATNTNAAVRYLKIYNASAPTSASTPILTIAIPGNTAGAGAVMNFDKGIAFGTAIGMRATTGAADNDTGAVAANELIANVLYK